MIIDLKVRVAALENKNDAGGMNYMIFRGVVDVLPDTASEGEVYMLTAYKQYGSYINDCNMYINTTSFGFEGWGDLANAMYNEMIGLYYPTIKFIINGKSYVYTECGINGAGEYGCDFYGETTAVSSYTTVANGATVEVYFMTAENAVAKSYIYHDGGFIEL